MLVIVAIYAYKAWKWVLRVLFIEFLSYFVQQQTVANRDFVTTY